MKVHISTLARLAFEQRYHARIGDPCGLQPALGVLVHVSKALTPRRSAPCDGRRFWGMHPLPTAGHRDISERPPVGLASQILHNICTTSGGKSGYRKVNNG
jgi:hypothetical protein